MRGLGLALASLLLAGAAWADGATFSFIGHLGDDGKTDTLTAGSFSLTAEGFMLAPPFAPVAIDLWAKNTGPTESGMGEATGVDHEISGLDFIELDLTSVIARNPTELLLGLNSLQAGESYDVWGSNGPGILGTMLASTNSPTFNLLPFIGKYDDFSVTAVDGSTILIDAVTVATSEPPMLLLLGAGLAVILIFFRRRMVTA
jgi:hypothetical protein